MGQAKGCSIIHGLIGAALAIPFTITELGRQEACRFLTSHSNILKIVQDMARTYLPVTMQ